MINRIKPFSLCILFIFSFIFTAIAGIISIHIATKFYADYPFHYDSASYIYTSLRFSHLLKIMPFTKVLMAALATKDGLDVILRLLFFPGALAKTFGHMYILLPFMASFIFLLMYYVYRRTNFISLSLLSAVALFAFPYIYTPYWGIADYWKGNLGIWLLGNALVCLLLSNFLRCWKWNLLASIFLGLLIWQRSALAVYTAIFLIPYFFVAVLLQIKKCDLRSCLINMFAFIIPVSLIASVLILIQWKLLYTYYFVAEYGYVPYLEIYHFIISNINYYIHIPFIAFNSTAIIIFGLFFNKTKCIDFFIALWFLLGFIFSVLLIRGVYEELSNVLWILTVLFFSTSLLFLTESSYTCLKCIVIALLFLSSIFYSTFLWITFNKNPGHWIFDNNKPWKTIYSKIAQEAISRKVHFLALLNDESYMPLLDQIKLDNKVAIFSDIGLMSVGFMAQHDTYYITKFNLEKMNIKQMAQQNIKNIESYKNVIVITYCSAEDAAKSIIFTGQKIAGPYAVENSMLISQDPKWKLIKTLDSPEGCLNVYWYNHPNTIQ